MPLTKNGANHARRTTRKAWSRRTSPITLSFSDRPHLTVQGIWKTSDTTNPSYQPDPGAGTALSANTADAAAQFLLDDVDLGTLAAVTHMTPASYDGTEPSGLTARYIPISIEPKGIAFPPDRAYVLLRKE